MKRILLLASLGLSLAACGSIAKPNPETGPSRSILGLLEVRLENVGEGLTPIASAQFVNPQRFSGRLGTQAMDSRPLYTNTNLAFTRQRVAFIDTNGSAATTDVNTTGATRYITATFDVTNNTINGFDNLTLVATSIPAGNDPVGAPTGTIGGTGFTSIVRGDGTSLSNSLTADVDLAQKILPAGGVSISETGVKPEFGMTDLQFITSGEVTDVKADAAAFVTPIDLDPLEYAFVAHNLNSGRSIPNGGGIGRITLGYKLPKVNPRQVNPFAFVMYFVVVNDTLERGSQSPEEQTTTQFNSLYDTATTDFRVIEGSRLIYRDDLENFCSIRIADRRAGTDMYYNPVQGTATTRHAALSAEPDCGFGASGRRANTFGSNDVVSGVAMSGSDAIVVGTTGLSPNRDFAVWKLDNNGKTVDAFGTSGKTTIDFGGSDDQAAGVVIQSDGKIVVVGNNGPNFAITRLNSGGTIDASFDGSSGDFTCFPCNGIITKSITPGNDHAAAVTIQASNSRILVAGTSDIGGSDDFSVLSLLTSGGQLDTAFGAVPGNGIETVTPSGGVGVATSITLDSNNKVYVAGYAGSTINPTGYDFAVLRLTANGSLDTTSFNAPFGKVTVDLGNSSPDSDKAYSVVVYPNTHPTKPNAVVLAGDSGGGLVSSTEAALVQLDASGALDAGFGSGGKFNFGFGSTNSDRLRGMAMSGDNLIVTGFTTSNLLGTTSNFALARVTPTGTLDTAFSGDGKQTVDVYEGSDDEAASIAVGPSGNYIVAGTLVNASSDFSVIKVKQ